jgi:hypothetical protein
MHLMESLLRAFACAVMTLPRSRKLKHLQIPTLSTCGRATEKWLASKGEMRPWITVIELPGRNMLLQHHAFAAFAIALFGLPFIVVVVLSLEAIRRHGGTEPTFSTRRNNTSSQELKMPLLPHYPK